MSFAADGLETLRIDIEKALGTSVVSIDGSGRDEIRRSFRVQLQDDSNVVVHSTAPSIPGESLKSEVATLDYLRTHSTIPVARVLYTNYQHIGTVRPYILLEKVGGIYHRCLSFEVEDGTQPNGVTLDALWDELAPLEQSLIVGQVARWMMDLFALRFDKIGSLYALPDNPGEVYVGEIIQAPFYAGGRGDYPLDRGPFASTKEYLSGCAQRELDCSRFMFSQDTSAAYQQKVEEEKFQVERSMTLFQHLIDKCEGLDDLDQDMAPFSLDMHDLRLKNLVVDISDPTRIVSVDFPALTTQPLWACARIPSWLTPSMTDGPDSQKTHLAEKFRQTVTGVEGYHSLFLRGIDCADTRHALAGVCKYDAFRDSFLILPTLESIAATLPGEEDMDGLRALLDPSTLEGRVARIALMTRGPGAMSLAADSMAFEAPSSPKVTPGDSTEGGNEGPGNNDLTTAEEITQADPGQFRRPSAYDSDRDPPALRTTSVTIPKTSLGAAKTGSTGISASQLSPPLSQSLSMRQVSDTAVKDIFFSRGEEDQGRERQSDWRGADAEAVGGLQQGNLATQLATAFERAGSEPPPPLTRASGSDNEKEE